MGQSQDVPSNVTFPDQKEKYLFFNVRFNKPNYRSYVRQNGNYEFIATRGQFSLKKLAKEGRAGGSLFDLMNHFYFKGAGFTSSNVNGDTTNQNISVDQINFNSEISVKASEIPANQVMITASLLEKDGLYFPMDIKSLRTLGTTNLKSQSTYKNHVLSLVKVDDQQTLSSANLQAEWAKQKQSGSVTLNQMSIALQSEDDAKNFAPSFIPLVAPPELISSNTMKLQSPIATNINPASTFLILSKVEKFNINGQVTERVTRVWNHKTDGWVDNITIPQVEWNREPNTIYRWEVLFLGSKQQDLSDGEFETITHISRNSFEF